MAEKLTAKIQFYRVNAIRSSLIILLIILALFTVLPLNQTLTSANPYSSLTWTKLKETDHFIFYFNTTSEDFVNQYAAIAERGYPGLEGIFGRISNKTKILLCETVEELEAVYQSFGKTISTFHPNFNSSEAYGECINGPLEVHIYKPAEFKPGGSYANGLLHEIGHAVYTQLYPISMQKNNWLNEALAHKSVSGTKIDFISTPRLKYALQNGSFIKLVDLEKNSNRTAETEKGINFEEYVSFVNFIATGFGFNKLKTMLEYYNGGEDLVGSIEKSFSLSASEFETRWLAEITLTFNLKVKVVIPDSTPIQGLDVVVWKTEEDPAEDNPSISPVSTDAEGIAVFQLIPGEYFIGFNLQTFPSKYVLPSQKQNPITVAEGVSEKTIQLQLKTSTSITLPTSTTTYTTTTSKSTNTPQTTSSGTTSNTPTTTNTKTTTTPASTTATSTQTNVGTSNLPWPLIILAAIIIVVGGALVFRQKMHRKSN